MTAHLEAKTTLKYIFTKEELKRILLKLIDPAVAESSVGERVFLEQNGPTEELSVTLLIEQVAKGSTELALPELPSPESYRAPCGYRPGDCSAMGTGCLGCGDNPELGKEKLCEECSWFKLKRVTKQQVEGCRTCVQHHNWTNLEVGGKVR